MIVIKTEHQLEIMREAAKVTAYILDEMMEKIIKPGITTATIDRLVEAEIRKNHMVPAFKGLYGFPASICASVNETIVHGIPSSRKLVEGDIISIDTGTLYKDYYSDAARTYPVGEVSEEKAKLIRVTRESFFKGIENAKVGNRLYDISREIQAHAESNGFSVVREFVGHGIGKHMHEDPQIPNYVPDKRERHEFRNPRLEAGMALAIEPMINAGGYECEVLEDNWTTVTTDGKSSAHYENTIIITDGEPEILTILK